MIYAGGGCVNDGISWLAETPDEVILIVVEYWREIKRKTGCVG